MDPIMGFLGLPSVNSVIQSAMGVFRDKKQHKYNTERDAQQHKYNTERDAQQHANNIARDAQKHKYTVAEENQKAANLLFMNTKLEQVRQQHTEKMAYLNQMLQLEADFEKHKYRLTEINQQHQNDKEKQYLQSQYDKEKLELQGKINLITETVRHQFKMEELEWLEFKRIEADKRQNFEKWRSNHHSKTIPYQAGGFLQSIGFGVTTNKPIIVVGTKLPEDADYIFPDEKGFMSTLADDLQNYCGQIATIHKLGLCFDDTLAAQFYNLELTNLPALLLFAEYNNNKLSVHCHYWGMNQEQITTEVLSIAKEHFSFPKKILTTLGEEKRSPFIEALITYNIHLMLDFYFCLRLKGQHSLTFLETAKAKFKASSFPEEYKMQLLLNAEKQYENLLQIQQFFEEQPTVADTSQEVKDELQKAIEHSKKEEPDWTNAKAYCLSAAEKNYPAAQYQLARWYYLGHFGNLKDGEKEARFWYTKAAELGDKEAQYQLGRLYEKEKNIAEAKKWYAKAAEQGQKDAASNLSKINQ